MQQINTILQTIKEHHGDGMVLISPISRYWITQLKTSLGYLLINAKGESIFITDTRYSLIAQQTLAPKTTVLVISNQPGKDLASLFSQAMKTLNIQKVLIEYEYLGLSDLHLLKPYQLIQFKAKRLRLNKTADELKKLQKAADIAVATVEWVWTWIKPGCTENEVARKIAIHFLELGAQGNSFETIVAAGKNGASPHHETNDYAIQDGDMVTLDLGCMYENYASDMTRSFVVGEQCNTPEMIEIYNTVKQAQQMGLDASKENANTKAVDSVCRDFINHSKYKDLFGHGTGHGVGLEVHELPVISPSYDESLLSNQLITIEPGIYKPNVGGVRIEDTIVITKDGHINLTGKCSKELKYICN